MKRTNQKLLFEAKIHGVEVSIPDTQIDAPELSEKQKAEMEQVFFQQRQRMMKRG